MIAIALVAALLAWVPEAGAGEVDVSRSPAEMPSIAVLVGKPLEASAEYSLGEPRAALAIHRPAETGRWERVWDC